MQKGVACSVELCFLQNILLIHHGKEPVGGRARREPRVRQLPAPLVQLPCQQPGYHDFLRACADHQPLPCKRCMTCQATRWNAYYGNDPIGLCCIRSQGPFSLAKATAKGTSPSHSSSKLWVVVSYWHLFGLGHKLATWIHVHH